MARENKNGFTVVELLIVLGLAGIVMLAIIQLSDRMNKDLRKSMKLADEMNSLFLGQKQLLRDFQKIGPSYNGIKIPDCDDEPTRRERDRRYFFDFSATDTSANSTDPRLGKRKLVLSPGKNLSVCRNPIQELLLILSDTNTHSIQKYDPKRAYGGWWKSNGPLVYVGLNQQIATGSMPGIIGSDGKHYLDFMSPDLWRAESLYSLESPDLLPELETTGTPLRSGRSRSLFFLGIASTLSQDLLPLSSLPALKPFVQSGTIRVDHPQKTYLQAVRMNRPIDSADRFLRALSPVGGQVAYAFLKKVRLVKYRITSDYNLMRSEWEKNAWSKEALIMADIKEIVLTRPMLATQAIDFDIINTGVSNK